MYKSPLGLHGPGPCYSSAPWTDCNWSIRWGKIFMIGTPFDLCAFYEQDSKHSWFWRLYDLEYLWEKFIKLTKPNTKCQIVENLVTTHIKFKHIERGELKALSLSYHDVENWPTKALDLSKQTGGRDACPYHPVSIKLGKRGKRAKGTP